MLDTHSRSSSNNFEQRIEASIAGLEALLQRILRIPTQETTVDPNSYVESPFVPRIAEAWCHRKLNAPTFRLYDTTTDTDEHIAIYKQKMLAADLHVEDREALYVLDPQHKPN